METQNGNHKVRFILKEGGGGMDCPPAVCDVREETVCPAPRKEKQKGNVVLNKFPVDLKDVKFH